MLIEKIKKINLINLPKVKSLLIPSEYELLPNITELFELEFALYEYKFLNKKEIIERGAYFKSVDKISFLSVTE